MASSSNNPCSWLLSNLESPSKTAPTVMSTFACGGGSSMGYKRAGFKVVAANDIDKDMEWHYQNNVPVPYYFRCPVKDLVNADLPNECFNLDVLDGSPPCSTFSMSGNREKDWGKMKHFREGQAEQVLDDLFFDFLDVAERLQPKVIIAENVKGMLAGSARGYLVLIKQRLEAIGYRPQLFLLNAADYGVPQKRERVFFAALRNDIDKQKLIMPPKLSKVYSAKEAIQDLNDSGRALSSETADLWKLTTIGSSFQKAKAITSGKHNSWFNHIKLDPDKPCPTVLAVTYSLYHWSEPRRFGYSELLRFQGFPDDYKSKSDSLGYYLLGMSVPPQLTEAVATAVRDQWLTT